jgi:HTH-type transcriptional regulator/antitoxin HipB
MNQPVLTATQLGRLLQSARKARNMTQQDLATRVGLSQKRISALELNPGAITADQLMTLCSILGLEIVVQQKPEPGNAQKAQW